MPEYIQKQELVLIARTLLWFQILICYSEVDGMDLAAQTCPIISFIHPTYLIDIKRKFMQTKVKAGREGERGNAPKANLIKKKKSNSQNL